MIQYCFRNHVTYDVKQWKFPSGEVGVSLTCGCEEGNNVKICARMQNSDDIMALCLTVDALRRKYFGIDIQVVIPYLPYARQDRVCHDGESLSISVIAAIINSLNFKKVTLVDPHSDVAGAVINNSYIVDAVSIWSKLLTRESRGYDAIIAPDAGAYKKAVKMADYLGVTEVIVANKVRGDVGKIISHELTGNVEGKKVAVFDDICDGGATFVNLARLLKEQGVKEKHLFVTHGIFTKGQAAITIHYDKVTTTNSYHPNIVSNGVTQIINLDWKTL